jgi:hypothetical protein
VCLCLNKCGQEGHCLQSNKFGSEKDSLLKKHGLLVQSNHYISEFVFASDGFILVATFPAIFQYSFSVIFQYSHSIEHLSENVKSGLSMMHRLDANNTAETSNSEWLLQVRFHCASIINLSLRLIVVVVVADEGEGLVT